MNTHVTRSWLRRTAFLALCAATPWVAWAELDEPALGDGYEAGAYGRVRFAEAGLTIRRAASDGEPNEGPTTNAPVFPGDTVASDRAQRAEIELANATLVRLAEDTEVTFLSLPDPYAEIADHTVLQLHRGSMRIASRLGENEELRLDTPAASIYPLGSADLRVDVAEDGTTIVASFRGVVEVAGSGGSVVVRGGTRSRVFPGAYPEDPDPFHTFAQDDFDRWVAGREAVYEVHERDRDPAYNELPQEVRPYYRELSANGRWVWVEDQGYVWSPTYVSSTWRPYYDGYWSYGPSGYFWVSSEPWGWAPYHYGRWSWTQPYGWCWAPGRVFAGAWVAWSWGAVHVGWAPLGYWNQPGYIGGVYGGYYDPACWTFVGYSHVGSHYGYGRHAVPLGDVDVRNQVVVSRAPAVPPGRLARSPEARAEAVREARATPAGRVRAIDRTSRPEVTMRDLERRQIERRGARATDPVQRDVASRVPASRFPRQLADGSGTGTRPGARAIRSGSPVTLGARPGEADGRVRDLYRRMASPRTTREDGVAPSRDTTERPRTPRAGQREAPRATPAPAPREAAPRSTDGRKDAAPPRSNGSADGEREKPGSRTPDRPRSQDSDSPRPAPERTVARAMTRPIPVERDRAPVVRPAQAPTSPRASALRSTRDPRPAPERTVTRVPPRPVPHDRAPVARPAQAPAPRASAPRSPRPNGAAARPAPPPPRAAADRGRARDATRGGATQRSTGRDGGRSRGNEGKRGRSTSE